MATRKQIIDRERAIATARNTKDSKTGKFIMSGNKHESTLLENKLKKMEKQLKRSQMHMEQHKKRFLQTQSLYTYEPLIIVERPPSPQAGGFGVGGSYPLRKERPGYMKPIRTKTPSNLPTIDAFTVRQKKKVNLWEEAINDNTRFMSTVPPSAPLTEEERYDLKRGWIFHRPQTRLEDIQKEALEASKKTKPNAYKSLLANKNKKKSKKTDVKTTLAIEGPPLTHAEDVIDANSTTFVTQMPMDLLNINAETSGNAKNVTFSHRSGGWSSKTPSPVNGLVPKQQRHSAEPRQTSRTRVPETIEATKQQVTPNSASSLSRTLLKVK